MLKNEKRPGCIDTGYYNCVYNLCIKVNRWNTIEKYDCGISVNVRLQHRGGLQLAPAVDRIGTPVNFQAGVLPTTQASVL